jgi:hypothetical protein
MSRDQALPVAAADASVRQVMTVTGRHRIGAVVMVDGNGHAAGTIDDRCVLDGLLRGYELNEDAGPQQRPPELGAPSPREGQTC